MAGFVEVEGWCGFYCGFTGPLRVVELTHNGKEYQEPCAICERCRGYLRGYFRYAQNVEIVEDVGRFTIRRVGATNTTTPKGAAPREEHRMADVYGWHFTNADGTLGYEDGRKVVVGETITERLAPALRARATYGLLPYGALSAAAREVGASRAMAALAAKRLGLTVYTKKGGPPLGRRGDGRVERYCQHGVGHTVAIPDGIKTQRDRRAWFVHGCDGCCGGWV